jgi:hypothetical protein
VWLLASFRLEKCPGGADGTDDDGCSDRAAQSNRPVAAKMNSQTPNEKKHKPTTRRKILHARSEGSIPQVMSERGASSLFPCRRYALHPEEAMFRGSASGSRPGSAPSRWPLRAQTHQPDVGPLVRFGPGHRGRSGESLSLISLPSVPYRLPRRARTAAGMYWITASVPAYTREGAARPAEPLRWRLGGAGVVVDVCLPPVLFLHVPVWNVHVLQRGMIVLVRVGGQ